MPDKKTFNKVLIIDDDYASVYLTKVILEDMAIAEKVLTASDGDKGLEKIKHNCLNEHAATSECPDLILIDINMPGLSGLEVVEELHKIGQSNLIQAKVVVLTASSHVRDMDKMLQFGVKQYLEKPITEEKVSQLIGNTTL